MSIFEAEIQQREEQESYIPYGTFDMTVVGVNPNMEQANKLGFKLSKEPDYILKDQEGKAIGAKMHVYMTFEFQGKTYRTIHRHTIVNENTVGSQSGKNLYIDSALATKWDFDQEGLKAQVDADMEKFKSGERKYPVFRIDESRHERQGELRLYQLIVTANRGKLGNKEALRVKFFTKSQWEKLLSGDFSQIAKEIMGKELMMLQMIDRQTGYPRLFEKKSIIGECPYLIAGSRPTDTGPFFRFVLDLKPEDPNARPRKYYEGERSARAKYILDRKPSLYKVELTSLSSPDPADGEEKVDESPF